MNYEKLSLELFQQMKDGVRDKHAHAVGGEAFVLLHIAEKEVVLPKEISGAMGVSSARIAAALNELEDKGLITREIDKTDRRKIIVRLTPQGLVAADTKRWVILSKITERLKFLGEQDAREYVRIMGRLAEFESRNNAVPEPAGE